MKRLAPVVFLIAVLGIACGDLEQDRICLNPPCQVPGQTKECAAYVACYERTVGTPGVLDSTYGKNGVCWQNDSSAMACTSACISAVASLRSISDGGCPSP